MQTIKVKSGDPLSHNGKNYRVNKSISLKVTAERNTDTVVAPSKEITPIAEEVKGEGKSDPAQGVPKAAVLELIQKKIEVLEKHENELLMEGVFDAQDDLDLIDQQRGENYKTANYAATTVHIMDLKSLYNQVKNLS